MEIHSTTRVLFKETNVLKLMLWCVCYTSLHASVPAAQENSQYKMQQIPCIFSIKLLTWGVQYKLLD